MAAGSSPIAVFNKDPNAVLDYTVNWNRWLGDDTISSAVWTIPAGMGNAGTAYSNTTATVWLTGGVAGTSYSVYVQIITAGGRSDKRTVKIVVVDR